MLEAALDRTYSGNPSEGFFTAGGLQSFANFDIDGKWLGYDRSASIRTIRESGIHPAYARHRAILSVENS